MAEMNFLEMPVWYQQMLTLAFAKKDKRAIITMNREWRLFLKQRFDITLKG